MKLIPMKVTLDAKEIADILRDYCSQRGLIPTGGSVVFVIDSDSSQQHGEYNHRLGRAVLEVTQKV